MAYLTSNRSRWGVDAAVLIGCIASAPAHADVATLQPVADNAIYEENVSSSNGGGYIFIGTAGGGGIRRALLRFDVASAIPAGASIQGAELSLTVSRASNGAPLPVSLHRLLSSWGEAASNAGERAGAGAQAQPGDATWISRFYSSLAWISAGGDFAPVASATGSDLGVGTFTFPSSSGLVADVQVWLDSPASNFGWIVLGDESEATTARRINSREHADIETRPELTVTYVSAAPESRSVPIAWWAMLVAAPLLSLVASTTRGRRRRI